MEKPWPHGESSRMPQASLCPPGFSGPSVVQALAGARTVVCFRMQGGLRFQSSDRDRRLGDGDFFVDAEDFAHGVANLA
jgi:hypothetical protein